MSVSEACGRVLEQRVVSLEGHSDSVTNVVEMPDYLRVATACWDEVIRIFDVGTGELLRECKGHIDPVFGLAALSNTLLASGGGGIDRTLRVWDVCEGICLSSLDLRGQIGGVGAIAVLPEERILATAGKDLVFLQHVAGRDLVETSRLVEAHAGIIRDVAVGRGLVFTVSDDKTVRVWDPQALELRSEIKDHVDAVVRISLSEELLATVSKDNTCRMYRSSTLEPVRILSELHRNGIYGVDILGSVEAHVLTFGNDGLLRLTSVISGKVKTTLDMGFRSNRVKILGDGRIAVVGSTRSARILVPPVAVERLFSESVAQKASIMR